MTAENNVSVSIIQKVAQLRILFPWAACFSCAFKEVTSEKIASNEKRWQFSHLKQQSSSRYLYTLVSLGLVVHHNGARAFLKSNLDSYSLWLFLRNICIYSMSHLKGFFPSSTNIFSGHSLENSLSYEYFIWIASFIHAQIQHVFSCDFF